ncbi:hypothetical protein A9Q89_03215 [Gammaproteobacteria bacterium 53_120_T64]|nr:hypothetical protein A9Q89_03215 [Gammaproteobacteria bacterium 53_120_T64]
MQKMTLALLMVISLSTVATSTMVAAEIKPLSFAAYTIDLIEDQVFGTPVTDTPRTRTELKDSLHKKCLTGELQKKPSVEKASITCRDFITVMSEPRHISMIDFLWLQMTMKTITSKAARAMTEKQQIKGS